MTKGLKLKGQTIHQEIFQFLTMKRILQLLSGTLIKVKHRDLILIVYIISFC